MFRCRRGVTFFFFVFAFVFVFVFWCVGEAMNIVAQEQDGLLVPLSERCDFFFLFFGVWVRR